MALAACQSGDSGGGSGNMLGFGGAKEPKPPEEGKVLASELTAYCPRVIVKEAESTINRYAKGGEGDPAKLSWQASISESTRSCSRQTGMLQMNVAVAGRVVPGPAGASGTVTLPVKVTVMQGDGTALYTQTFNQQVTLAGTQAQQFLLSDQNVVVPIPADNTLQVFAGFDTGTSKKKQSEELF
ncbi:MAG: hypothetical protein KF810_18135 [Rhizobiaceae bacterium]|nr:hypothetical protein [Rhizobiaceae bacterium]